MGHGLPNVPFEVSVRNITDVIDLFQPVSYVVSRNDTMLNTWAWQSAAAAHVREDPKRMEQSQTWKRGRQRSTQAEEVRP